MNKGFDVRNSQVGDLLVATTEVDGTILNRGVCLLVYEDEGTAVGVMLNRPMHLFQPPAVEDPSGQGDSSSSAQTLGLSLSEATGQVDTEQPKAGQASSKKPGETKVTNRLLKLESAGVMSNPQVPPTHKIAIVGPANDSDAGKFLMGKSLYFGGPLSGPVVAVHGASHLAEAEAGEGIFVAAQRDNLEALLQSEQHLPYRLIVGHLGWTQEQLTSEIEGGVWHRVRATNEILSTADDWLWPNLIRSATAGSVSRWLGKTHVADAHLLN